MLRRTFSLTVSDHRHICLHIKISFSLLILEMAPRADTQALFNYYFYRNPDDPSLFLCKNEIRAPRHGRKLEAYKQERKLGLTNLRNHLRFWICDDYQAKYVEHLNKCGEILDSFRFSNAPDGDMFKIVEGVVMRNWPLSKVYNEPTRVLFNVKPVSSKSLQEYILSLIPLVEDAIIKMLPNNFCEMFDGW